MPSIIQIILNCLMYGLFGFSAYLLFLFFFSIRAGDEKVAKLQSLGGIHTAILATAILIYLY